MSWQSTLHHNFQYHSQQPNKFSTDITQMLAKNLMYSEPSHYYFYNKWNLPLVNLQELFSIFAEALFPSEA